MFQLPKTISLLGAAMFAMPLVAQQDQEALIEKRDAKVAAMSEKGWVTDYSKAREMAAESGKMIFVYFTRSYAP
ncbi:MAG: hypothetical protein AAF196_12475 [Planctomycetota bacterium]